MEHPFCDSPLDSFPRQPGLQELRERDDAVLLRG